MRGRLVSGIDVVIAGDDLDHLDRILRALGRGDRTHEGLVRVLDVRIHHVEVALVHRNIDRFANGAAGVVQAGAHIGQLDEILEVFDGRVAATVFDVVDERAAVGRYENGILATDLHVTRRVARVLGIFGLRGSLDDGAAQPAREACGYAVDFGAALLEDIQRLGHVAKLDTGLFENCLGIILDQLQAFLVEYFEDGNLALDIRCADAGLAATCASCVASPAASAASGSCRFAHVKLRVIQSYVVTRQRASMVDCDYWRLTSARP